MSPRGYRDFLIKFFTVFFIFLFLDFLSAPPGRVEDPLAAGHWISILGQFLLWVFGILAWGQVILRFVDSSLPSAGLSLATGSLLYAIIAFLLGIGELLQPDVRYFLFILQSLGLALSPLPRLVKLKWSSIAYLPLGLIFLLLALDSLPIHSYWDPLHHHLVGARQFWEAGKIYFPADSVASFQEGGFELLFLWPHFLFAKTGGLGLLPVQIFGQLTHSILGFGGTLVLAHGLIARWISHPAWRAFSLSLFAIPASLQFAIPMAKNDWGIVLWVLSGYALLTRNEENQGNPNTAISILPLVGLIWGFSFIAKLSSAFAIAGLSIALLYRRPPPKGLVLFALGFVIGMAPLSLRNWIYLGNPFFPLLQSWFPESILGPTWIAALAKYQEAPSALLRIKELIQEFPMASVCLMAPVLAFHRKSPVGQRVAGAGVTIGFCTFAMLAGKATELRLLGAVLPLAGLVSGLIITRIVSGLPVTLTHLPWLILAMVSLILPYRWEAIRRLHTIPNAHLLVRSYVSGEAQSWFRSHYRFGMKAALLVESRFYHSLPFPVVRIWDSPRLDARLHSSKNASEFLKILRDEGFTHLILSQEKLDLFYPADLVGQVEAYVLPQEGTFVFKSPFSIVADLSKVK